MTYHDILLWMTTLTVVIVFVVWLGIELQQASHAVGLLSHGRLKRSAISKDDIVGLLHSAENYNVPAVKAAIQTSR
jgi:hypothetical protein